ncbi:MAG: hypothetical protein HYV08_17725 [Deltaproteobacteria bacterium]|nr:hypothetical protein [Deltaproteobacteria bacterium]MBI3078065.1 hypothetical protein [Deltaproteobacteria bacterium]
MATRKSARKPIPKCQLCGRPSASVICEACGAKVRAEAMRRKQQIEKGGRTDTGRR